MNVFVIVNNRMKEIAFICIFSLANSTGLRKGVFSERNTIWENTVVVTTTYVHTNNYICTYVLYMQCSAGPTAHPGPE